MSSSSSSSLEESWRAGEIRRRLQERAGASSETKHDQVMSRIRPRTLLEAGKRQLKDRVESRWLVNKFQSEVEKFDGITQLCLTEQDLEQSVVLRRSEQSWEIAKQLRSIGRSVRRQAEGGREHLATLERIEHRLLDIRDAVSSNDDEESDKDCDERTNMGLAQMRRGQNRKKRIADAEIEAELAMVKSKTKIGVICPHCNKMQLDEFVTQHVTKCKQEQEDKTLLPMAAQAQHIQETTDLEKIVRRKMVLNMRQEMEHKRRSFLSTVEVCPECGKQVLSSRLAKHLGKCQEQQRLLLRARLAEEKKLASREADRLGELKPQPPTNVRLVRVSSDLIEIEWEPPLYMGGYNVFVHDYVIEYAIRRTKRNGKRVEEFIEPQPALSTSCFCKLQPVSLRSYTVTHLRANTEYVNICVRSKNLVGLSEPSSAIESVTTDGLSNPSPPLHLMLARATCSSLVFVWSEPVGVGGATNGINRYEITFSRMVERNARKGKEMVTETVEIPASRRCFSLQDLEAHSKVFRISVVAVIDEFVNGEKTVLRSERSEEIRECQTLEPSRSDLLRLEIRRISHINTDFVDSSAYAGFMQRYSRVELIDKLEKDLKRLEKKAKKEEESVQPDIQKRAPQPAWGKRRTRGRNGRASTSAATMKSQSGSFEAFPVELLVEHFGYDQRSAMARERENHLRMRKDNARATMVEANKTLGTGEIPMRRKHFEYRIHKLRSKVQELEDKRAGLVVRRSLITKDLAGEDMRVTELIAEHDRVSAHSGEFIDSCVLHGRFQRFHTWSLKDALAEEVRAGKEKIVQGKIEQVRIQNDLRLLVEELEKTEQSLKDREARLLAFEKEIEKKEKALDRVRNWKRTGLAQVFSQWVDFVQEKKREKDFLRTFLMRMQNVQLSKGWLTWKQFTETMREREQAKQGVTGLGSYMLENVHEDRQDIAKGLNEVIFSLRGTAEQLDESEASAGQMRALKSSPLYDLELEELRLRVRQQPEHYAQQTVLLELGKAYMSLGKFDAALKFFRSHTEKLTSGENGQDLALEDVAEPEAESEKDKKRRELFEMCECYYGMALCLQRTKRVDRAIVNFERTRSLGLECKSSKMEGLALLGIAQCNSMNGFYKVAIEYADRALIVFEDLNDARNVARSYRELEQAYKGICDDERASEFGQRAIETEDELQRQVHATYDAIARAQRNMISITADRSTELVLEVVSGKVPELRKQIEEKRTAAEEILKEAKRCEKANEMDRQRREVIKEQLEVVKNCKKEELDSDLVHGIMQRFKVPQLLENLKAELERLDKVIEDREKARKRAEILASNARDDMRELEETLSVELGPLMRKVIMGQQRFRCCALNPANVRSRDVTGLSSGGVEKMVCGMKDSIYVFDLRDGALLQILDGSKTRLDPNFAHKKRKDPSLPIPGHFGSISALFYSEHSIISGGVDKLVRVWKDDGDYTCELLLQGHVGTVWSLFADHDKVVSGSADKSVRIWSLRSKRAGKCVRTIQNVHRRSVMCLDVDGDTLATGSPDYEVRVWPNALNFSSKRVDPKAGMKSFIGHGCPVSCVKISASELVSGGEDGRIFVWNVNSGEVLNVCEGHTASIRGIQLDATKIVSSSADKTICVFDYATGSKLLTLRGHEEQILGHQFDLYRVLSVSSDGKARLWHWSGDKSERIPAANKLHVLQRGETLATLETKYGSSAADIMRWNNIQDMGRTLYVGMRLIVKKGILAEDKPTSSSEEHS